MTQLWTQARLAADQIPHWFMSSVYTDNCASLTEPFGIHNGTQVGAIDEAVKVPDVATTTPASVRAVGLAIG